MIYETLQTFLPSLPAPVETVGDEFTQIVFTEFFYMQIFEYFILCFFVILIFCGVMDIIKGLARTIIKFN